MQKTTENGRTFYSWQVGPSVFKALPEAGARLMSWDVKVAGQVRPVLYWPYGSEDWARTGSIRGGNPILFPFSGRTFHEGKIGFWKTPEGAVLPMAQHGYARQGHFEVESVSERGFKARFIPCEASAQAYPYAYTFWVEYTFDELGLVVDLILENRDTRPIPWSGGHHFYFALPWHTGGKRADYRVIIPAKKAFYHAADGALSKTDFTNEAYFNEPALSDRIHVKLKENVVRFGPRSGEEDIVIRIGESPVPSAWAAVLTWTQDETSPFYCVEPWMGPPNSPGHKNGLHFVDAGKTERFRVAVTLG